MVLVDVFKRWGSTLDKVEFLLQNTLQRSRPNVVAHYWECGWWKCFLEIDKNFTFLLQILLKILSSSNSSQNPQEIYSYFLHIPFNKYFLVYQRISTVERIKKEISTINHKPNYISCLAYLLLLETLYK